MCVCVCVCACACVCATHGGLSDTSALEIRSRGGSGFNSLLVRSLDFEKCWAIPLSACWSRFVFLCLWENMWRQMPKSPSLLRHSVFTFTVYSELTEIKTFTGINLAQSLHVCKPWCKRVLVWYPLARLHGLKQKYFQHCDVTNCPAPRIENIPNRDTTVSYRTVNFVNRYTPNIYIYIVFKSNSGLLHFLIVTKVFYLK